MRRHFFALFGGIALLATLIPAGSAAWMFAYDKASDNASVLVQGDPIRDNHVLGDDNDPDNAGQKFYDVYFAAQVTPNTTSDTEQLDEILPYTDTSFSPANPTYGDAQEPRLGRFEEELGYSYYKLYSGVTVINHTTLEDEVNAAFRCEVVDRTSDGWQLTLIGWTPQLVCNFAMGKNSHPGGESSHVHWPSADILTDNEYNIVKDDVEYIRVDGYYPGPNSGITLFSPNTILTTYDAFTRDGNDNIIDRDGNGRPDLVLYPILSVGKNNHVWDNVDDRRGITDAIGVELFPGKDSSGNEVDMGGQGSNATYDPRLSAKVGEHVSGGTGTKIEVFRYENVIFQEGSGSSLGFTLDPNRSNENGYGVGAGWPGNDDAGRWDGDAEIQRGHGDEDAKGGTVNSNETRFYITEGDSITGAAPQSITGLSGRYNIYFVDLINDDQQVGTSTSITGWNWPDTFTAENGLANSSGSIASAFSSYGVTPYQIVIIEHTKLVTVPRGESEWSWGEGHWANTFLAQTRALAIVLERVYEPRLVLGDTGSASFSNGKAFTQVAGPTRHTYTLMNVNLDGNTDYSIGDWETSNATFAVMLANQEDFTTYSMQAGPNVGQGPQDTASNRYDYSEFNSSYFEVFDYSYDDRTVSLVRPSSDENKGLYDLLITVEMKETEDGVNVPSAVKIYGRRRAVYYVNVSTSTAIESAPIHASGSLKGFVDTSIYDYRFEAFQQSEALTPETSFVSKDGTSTMTFWKILQWVYAEKGCYLQDIATGRIFTPMEFYEGSGATYEPQGSMALYLWKPGN